MKKQPLQIGEKINQWTVLEKLDVKYRGKQSIFKCQCSCGTIKNIVGTSMRQGLSTSCGCAKGAKIGKSKFIDLTGKQFGKLTVVQHAGSEKQQNKWFCKCACDSDKISLVTTGDLRSGHTKSCGCTNIERMKNPTLRPKPKRMDDYEMFINVQYSRYRTQANIKKREFSLSRQEFIGLIEGDCRYCGTSPSTTKDFNTGLRSSSYILEKERTKTFVKNGIDRINSSIGYRIDNVVSCCQQCNVAKLDHSYEEFTEWIKKVYHNLTEK
jgi:hypothetical protein